MKEELTEMETAELQKLIESAKDEISKRNRVDVMQKRMGERRKKTAFVFNGRTAIIERDGSEWCGHFVDDHTIMYIADTKRDVIAQMKEA